MNSLNAWYKAGKFLAILSLLGMIAACNLAPSSTNLFGNLVNLSTCYQVRYLGFSQEPNDVSTWNYRVEKLPCTQEFNSWVLEIPACAAVVDATPASYQVIQPDPNFQANWIQWQRGNTFQGGDFSVKLSGKLKRGTIQVGVIGSNVLTGEIQGPVCSLSATTTTISLTPVTLSSTPTKTATRYIFKTVTSAPPSVPTNVPTKASTPTPNGSPTSAHTAGPAISQGLTLVSTVNSVTTITQTQKP